ncbi:MAG: divergent PAP2 family protein, partial [Oscillospiraceae bacterium]|nr:divergent PAP2 family protein [Oscillospiraceae bacterium]
IGMPRGGAVVKDGKLITQGKELKNIKFFGVNFNDKISGNELKELLGHTPLEVLCGAILGITIGIIVPVL